MPSFSIHRLPLRVAHRVDSRLFIPDPYDRDALAAASVLALNDAVTLNARQRLAAARALDHLGIH